MNHGFKPVSGVHQRARATTSRRPTSRRSTTSTRSTPPASTAAGRPSPSSAAPTSPSATCSTSAASSACRPTTRVFVHNGTDPGNLGGGEEGEADLDVEWSGAVAPNATIKFVISKSTTTTDGVDLSAQYIVNNNVAQVMSTSFGQCESSMGTTENTFYNNLWSQAATQGITSFVSSGDSGAAGCNGGNDTTGSGARGQRPRLDAVQRRRRRNAVQRHRLAVDVLVVDEQRHQPELRARATSRRSRGTRAATSAAARASGPRAAAQSIDLRQAVVAGLRRRPGRRQRALRSRRLAHRGRPRRLPRRARATPRPSPVSAPSAAPRRRRRRSPASWRSSFRRPARARATRTRSSTRSPTRSTRAAARSIFHDVTSGNNSVPGVTGFNCGTGYDAVTGVGTVDANSMVNNWTARRHAGLRRSPRRRPPVSIAQGASRHFDDHDDRSAARSTAPSR